MEEETAQSPNRIVRPFTSRSPSCRTLQIGIAGSFYRLSYSPIVRLQGYRIVGAVVVIRQHQGDRRHAFRRIKESTDEARAIFDRFARRLTHYVFWEHDWSATTKLPPPVEVLRVWKSDV